jgi:hypothetical protein
MAASPRDVFINCPFDAAYAESFRALVFAVLGCGFRARCALEMVDAAETRIDKLYRIIEQSRFGIHDISRTELDPHNDLPRFNMPLELGIFLGARRFGEDDQKQKRAVVFDTEPYRYQQFISDLAGVDITAHEGDPRQMIGCVRNFLVASSRRRTIPTSIFLLDSYDRFTAAVPDIAANAGLDAGDIRFPDLERLILAWVKNNHGLAA